MGQPRPERTSQHAAIFRSQAIRIAANGNLLPARLPENAREETAGIDRLRGKNLLRKTQSLLTNEHFSTIGKKRHVLR